MGKLALHLKKIYKFGKKYIVLLCILTLNVFVIVERGKGTPAGLNSNSVTFVYLSSIGLP